MDTIASNKVLAGTLHVLQWWHWVGPPREEESEPHCLALIPGFSICLTTLLLLVESMAPSSHYDPRLLNISAWIPESRKTEARLGYFSDALKS